MNRYSFILLILSAAYVASAQAAKSPSHILLNDYASQGVSHVSAEQGKALWQKKFIAKGDFTQRSCTSCHTENLTHPGKHIKTGKAIKPMSPAVNPKRLTDIKKIKKWFKRNCKWTLGRECTAQEKADVLAYLSGKP